MVAVSEFQSDFDIDETYFEDELDLTFLETIENIDSLFTMSNSSYDVVAHMPHNKSFVSSLHDSVFQEPLHHVLWSASWPDTPKHFPS